MTFEIDTKEIKRFEAELKTFKARAYPFATKQTINKAAFETRTEAQQRIDKQFVTRNKWTRGSIQVEQARTLNVRQQAATVGSTEPYMAEQEFGGTKRKQGAEGVAIPTGYSAGQDGQQPRTRLPRKANKLQTIQLKKRSRVGVNRKQRNLIAVKQAVQTGDKHVFLDLGRRKGIFRVLGGKRNPRVKMVHDLTRQSVTIPRSPWLAPSVRKVEPRLPAIYRDALHFQLNRHGLSRWV